ncbi:MAG: MFS transporter [Gammaproteobacteria bacterium]
MITASQFKLLATRRFLPIFITQFLGAFNDNVFKNAIVILIVYVISVQQKFNPQIIVTIAAGILIVPFFLFSYLAGQFADKYEKGQCIRVLKIIEIVLMCFGALAFYFHNTIMLMVLLFLMGSQSTFFSPFKYSILPDHLHENELLSGNALLGAGTFVSILLGTIFGGTLILDKQGALLIGVSVILVALLGYLSSLFIPYAKVGADFRIKWNVVTETFSIMKYSAQRRDVFIAILANSWFWFLGSLFLAQFPAYTKLFLHANEDVVVIFISMFVAGIATGSLFCNQLLRNRVTIKYSSWALWVMFLFIAVLYFFPYSMPPEDGKLITASVFFQHGHHAMILIDLFCMAAAAGFYVVPLYAFIQAHTAPKHRARTIASLNVLNALAMVVSSLLTVVMFMMHFTILDVFLFAGVCCFLIGLGLFFIRHWE